MKVRNTNKSFLDRHWVGCGAVRRGERDTASSFKDAPPYVAETTYHVAILHSLGSNACPTCTHSCTVEPTKGAGTLNGQARGDPVIGL